MLFPRHALLKCRLVCCCFQQFFVRRTSVQFWRATHTPGLLVTSVIGFKPGWIPSPACNGFLRFTSSATPADLLVASMVAKPFWSIYLHTSIGGTQVQDWLCCCLTSCDKTDGLPTVFNKIRGSKQGGELSLSYQWSRLAAFQLQNLLLFWIVKDDKITFVNVMSFWIYSCTRIDLGSIIDPCDFQLWNKYYWTSSFNCII